MNGNDTKRSKELSDDGSSMAAVSLGDTPEIVRCGERDTRRITINCTEEEAESIEARSSMLKLLRSTRRFETMESPEQDLTFGSAKESFMKAGMELDEPRMESLGLRSEGRYTNLALLLSDQCPYTIKLASFTDEYKSEFLDRQEVGGSVLTQADDAYRFIRRNTKTRATFSGMNRIDTPEYPEAAVKEALVNAVLHRDYEFSSASILVSLFPRNMTVVSVGGLVPGIGLDDVVMGSSCPRNNGLMTVFYKLGRIAAQGTGIRKIREQYRNEEVKPVIEVSTNVFKITLPSPSAGEPEGFGKVEAFLVRNGPSGRADLERELGTSKSKVREIVNAMIATGRIERTGSGRGTKYRLRRRKEPVCRKTDYLFGGLLRASRKIDEDRCLAHSSKARSLFDMYTASGLGLW